MKTLGILHTTPATLEPLKALAKEIVPGCAVVNWVDDSILPQLAANGGNTGAVAERWVHYARFAERAGADVILGACSSVGELAEQVQAAVHVPFVRIDEAMAEEAVRRGSRIGVAATLATTLEPTARLLRHKAEVAGKPVTLVPALVEAAYRALMAGDQEGHDRVLAEALAELAPRADVVVLAQASMARVLPRLPEGDRARFLTSPRLAMERVRRLILEGVPA